MNPQEWLLPAYLPQPFDLRYLHDDLHVMARLTGHPEYEAVEAMIRLNEPRRPVVRAILTRHDQSQVDHVNDEQVFHAASAGRETVFGEITIETEISVPLPRVEVRFVSHRGEPVLLDLACFSTPDAARGGISDPGSHSLHTSLPVMLRGKSALAGAASRVHIGGATYAIPAKFRTPSGLVAHDGFFTETHHMAVLRAGSRALTLMELPVAFEVGAQWIYSSPQGQLSYRILSRCLRDSTLVVVRMDKPGERIELVARKNGLRMVKLHIASEAQPSDGVLLTFEADGNFSVAMDGHVNAVLGTSSAISAEGVRLHPIQPTWAVERPVCVTWSLCNDEVHIDTRIGQPH